MERVLRKTGPSKDKIAHQWNSGETVKGGSPRAMREDDRCVGQDQPRHPIRDSGGSRRKDRPSPVLTDKEGVLELEGLHQLDDHQGVSLQRVISDAR